MRSYDTLVEAINDLQKRGYTYDFSLKEDGLVCHSKKLKVSPNNFIIDELYRFEGMSNPGDNSILFAISASNNTKGLLVDAYGMYSENLSEEMLKKFK